MRAGDIAAAVAFLRCTFLDSRRKRSELFFHLFAAAVGTNAGIFAAMAFEKLIYPAALTALILEYRHIRLLTT